MTETTSHEQETADSTDATIHIWPDGSWLFSDDVRNDDLETRGDDYVTVSITAIEAMVEHGMERGEAESIAAEYA